MESFFKPRFFSHVCRHYGNLLMGLPSAVQDTLFQDLGAFYTWIQKKPLQWDMMTQALFPTCQRLIFVKAFLQDNVLSPQAMAFLHLLIRHKRLSLLPDLLQLCTVLRQEKTHTIVWMTSAAPVPAPHKKSLEDFFTQKFARDVALYVQVDPSLLLGATFTWDGFQINASLQGMLQRLAKDMHYER